MIAILLWAALGAQHRLQQQLERRQQDITLLIDSHVTGSCRKLGLGLGEPPTQLPK